MNMTNDFIALPKGYVLIIINISHLIDMIQMGLTKTNTCWLCLGGCHDNHTKPIDDGQQVSNWLAAYYIHHM